MSLYSPTTIQELINYCKLHLGEDSAAIETIAVDVTENQAIALVSDALQYFQIHHFNGSHPAVNFLTLTAGVRSYTLPSNTIAVLGYIDSRDSNIFSLDYQMTQQIGLQWRNFDLVTVQLTNQYLDMVKYLVSKKLDWWFDDLNKKFNIFNTNVASSTSGIGGTSAPSRIAVMTYESNDHETCANIYNERWLKLYCVQLFKRQQGENLKKFGGINLSGNVTIEAQTMFNEADAEIKRLEDELAKKWSFPPKFFVG